MNGLHVKQGEGLLHATLLSDSSLNFRLEGTIKMLKSELQNFKSIDCYPAVLGAGMQANGLTFRDFYSE